MNATARTRVPSVSVVIPTHNRPELMRRAVDAALDQDHPGDLEVIVVFDGTEPDTSIVREEGNRRVRVLRNERVRGLAGARNTGALSATGDYVAQCDDDDAWLPTKISAQLAVLEADPSASIAVTGVVVEYGDVHTPRVPPTDIDLDLLVRERVFAAHPSSYLSPATWHRKIGLVDEDLPGGYGEDWDWLIRAARIGSVAVVPEPLVRVTWGKTSFFQDRWQTIVDALTYLEDKHPEFDVPDARAYLDARRAFAHAAMGNRAEARTLAMRALRADATQKPAYAALAVGMRALSPSRALSLAHRAGRGI